MTDRVIHAAHVTSLADKLLGDIRRRGLAPGDRYLTTEQASRMLGVRKAAANGAMRYLAEQEILIRRQRAGTFVGPGFESQARSTVRTVYVLLPGGDPVAANWSMDPFVEGLHREMGDVNVQFSFVPRRHGVAYVRELIHGSLDSGQLAGVVPVSCPPEVYRELADLGVPAVAYGTLYSDQEGMPSVDIDNRQCGRLLTQYLIDRGHRRIAFFMTGEGRPGDNDFYDGISEVLAAAGLAHNALVQRLVPGDLEALEAMARQLLDDMADRPTAVIARSGVYADAVRSAASGLGLAVPDDVEIVFDSEDQTTLRVDQSLYPHVRSQLPFVQIAALIGGLLKRLAGGELVQRRRLVVPVDFREPTNARVSLEGLEVREQEAGV